MMARSAALAYTALPLAIACACLSLNACNVRGSGGPAQPFAGPVAGGVPLAQPHVVQVGDPPRWRLFPFSPSGAKYVGIAADPSGKYMWFSDAAHNSLVRMAMDGTVTSYPLTASSGSFAPGFFAFGKNGGIYIGGCIAGNCDFVGIMSPDHKSFSVVRTPSGDGPGQTNQFILGPNGNVWFLEKNHIAEIKGRSITEHASPLTPLGPNIVIGGDHKIWFDGQAGSQACGASGSACPFAGRIDPFSGRDLKTYFLGFTSSGYFVPYGQLHGGMATGANGDVFVFVLSNMYSCYYYCYDAYSLDEISSDGDQTRISVNGESGGASSNTSLTAGPGGNLWWGSGGYGFGPRLIDYNFVSGVHHFYLPDYGLGETLTTGGDDNIWGIDNQGNVFVYVINILRVNPTQLTLAVGNTAVLQAHYNGVDAPLFAYSNKPFVATVAKKTGGRFLVTAVHPGRATIVVQDTEYNSFQVPVTVT